MRKSANVRSITALQDARAAITEFRETAAVSLSEGQSEIQRTLSWLQNDRRMHWQRELRRREEKVNEARTDLYRAKLAAMDETATCIVERKALQRAEHRCEEAKQKIERVKTWNRKLEREVMLYRAQVAGLSRVVDAELPRGEARLEILLDRLDAYQREAAPTKRPKVADDTPAAPPASDASGDAS